MYQSGPGAYPDNFVNPGAGGPGYNRAPNVGPAHDPYPRSQGNAQGSAFAPQGMFDPHGQRGWSRGPFQLAPDQQQRYDSHEKNRYGSGTNYVQQSGAAPWQNEIWS